MRSKQKHHKSTIKRVMAIRTITENNYEPGNANKCYKAVWRKYIYPVYGCCYRTYLNYLDIPAPPETRHHPGQLFLFDTDERNAAE